MDLRVVSRGTEGNENDSLFRFDSLTGRVLGKKHSSGEDIGALV